MAGDGRIALFARQRGEAAVQPLRVRSACRGSFGRFCGVSGVQVFVVRFIGAKEVHVRKGERVTIVLTSKDFVHGFSVPDFHVRADAIPGKTVEITFVADKVGKFIFVCDNFCGEDHDKMMGFLVVADREPG